MTRFGSQSLRYRKLDEVYIVWRTILGFDTLIIFKGTFDILELNLEKRWII
jgi:hypothetical protein